MNPPAGDYRMSHLAKGDAYDALLTEDPFDAFMSARESVLLKRIVPRLFPQGVERYLDFACGTGRILRTVGPLAKKVYGVDVSATMLARAGQKLATATLLRADLTAEDTDIGQFDLITTFRFLGNAQDALRRSALAAIARRLVPGGYLVVDNHRNPWSLRNLLHRAEPALDLHHFRLRDLLRANGLEIVQVYGIGWWIVLDRQNRASVLFSRSADLLESLPVGRVLAWVCPDAVVVARRAHEI